MGKFFYIMGKSASGKDKIYKALAENPALGLRKFILYTTRPIREKEVDGREYHFTDEESLRIVESQGRMIERRDYETACGVWSYATVDDDSVDLEDYNYIAIGTLESFGKMKEYYGEDKVCPIYIESEDGLRLERALKRERKQAEPKYKEMCRRFLADCEDFSEEKIEAAGITRRFLNNGELADCLAETETYIAGELKTESLR